MKIQEELDMGLSNIGLQPESCLDEDLLDIFEDRLFQFSRVIGCLCKHHPPDLGAMIQHLDSLVKAAKNIDQPRLFKIASACKAYADRLTLENMYATRPIEEGIILMRAKMAHVRRNKEFVYDYSDVLEMLGIDLSVESVIKVVPAAETKAAPGAAPERISREDLEILVDFVSEALENFYAIEVNLVELEQDPSNQEIINDIFRPFHSIKGISGFLSLTKINHLSHATENLLDAARDGAFLIGREATDVILESVDTLKLLIERVNRSIRTGVRQPDDDIDIERIEQKIRQLQGSLPKGGKQLLGEVLVQQHAVDRETLGKALETQKASPGKKLGEILVTEQQVPPQKVAKALMEQGQVKKITDAQVKVSTDKLDDLVNYAGELVIAQSMLKQKNVHDASLNQTVAQLGFIVSKMQNIAMSMRMVPIKSTFMKMIRLVRDLTQKSGKQADLQMIGEDTEIDRNVVDALYEPMVHMIRNSVDHGIETGAKRLSAGKSVQGKIVLRAFHRGGHIVIEIEDDGKGLDRQAILDKARQTGLITGDEHMPDARVFDLIMQPGFSTAKEITDVSGRGVGMDVVRDRIEKLRGSLDIESKKGRGTRFTIKLPLTLAIIDGLLIRVDQERYVIPATAVQKAYKLAANDYFTVAGLGEMVKDRGNLIPLIRLNRICNTSEKKKPVKECLVVVVESKNEKRALLIDELLGKDEYVIKNLGGYMANVQGIAGGAILADGRVGLILDIHGIFQIASVGRHIGNLPETTGSNEERKKGDSHV